MCDIIKHVANAVFYQWLRGQAVKTSPFHGGNTGSIPVGVIHFMPKWRNLMRLTTSIERRALITNQLLLNFICRCGSIGRAADL